MAEIIKESYVETGKEHTLNFSFKSDRGCGFAFDCNADGTLTEETKAKPAAMKNYERATTETANVDGLMVRDGVKTRSWTYRVAAVIKCSRCGKEHMLGTGSYPDSQCVCKQNYNAFGQELRDNYQDRSTYAEYGERFDEDDY